MQELVGPNGDLMRCAVVGLGAMGWNHARVAHELGFLHVVADVSAATRTKAEKAYGVPASADIDQALNAVDAVIISTPTSTHFDLANRAIAKGKHVLVEKPLAPTVRECQELLDAAHAAGVVLAAGHIERHNPAVGYVKEQLSSGVLGRMLSMTARRVSNYPGRIRDVGCILDIGIHEIDIARYFAESEVVTVHALAGSERTNSYEDHALIQLGFANGISASIETNWLTPMRVRKSSLTCTGGLVELDYVQQTVRFSQSRFEAATAPSHYLPGLEFDSHEVALKRQEPLMREWLDFVSAIRNRREPLVSGRDGMQAVRIAAAALESATSGDTVHLPGI